MLRNVRSYRRYNSEKLITDRDITHILNFARLAASAGNHQRIRYVTLRGKYAKEAFSFVSLGGYLPKEQKPDPTVSASAYIVMLAKSDEEDPNLYIDLGIAAESIMLSASENGIGSCIIRNFDRNFFSEILNDDTFSPRLVIALGYPAEISVAFDTKDGSDLKYFKDENGINNVPKLPLSAVWLKDMQ